MNCDNCGRAMPEEMRRFEGAGYEPGYLEYEGVMFCKRRGCVAEYNYLKLRREGRL